MQAEVVKEEGEDTTTQLLCKLPNESNKALRVNSHRVYCKVNEPTILGDRGDERQSLNFQIGVVDLDPVPLLGPPLGPESSKGEHGLIQVDNLSV